MPTMVSCSTISLMEDGHVDIGWKMYPSRRRFRFSRWDIRFSFVNLLSSSSVLRWCPFFYIRFVVYVAEISERVIKRDGWTLRISMLDYLMVNGFIRVSASQIVSCNKLQNGHFQGMFGVDYFYGELVYNM